MTKLSRSEIARIKAEVKQAAIDHLNAREAETALSHFTEDVIAVSNTQLFPSLEALAEDVHAYYKNLKEVDLAVWDEMHIKVINKDTAIVTARFRYSFTNIEDQRIDLQGVWTSMYVRRADNWRISLRHESFETLKK